MQIKDKEFLFAALWAVTTLGINKWLRPDPLEATLDMTAVCLGMLLYYRWR